MASLNRVILIGNVGRDPEIKFLPSGDPVASLTLATTDTWKNKQGEKQEKTEWHRIDVFGSAAKVVQDYVTKGRQLYVEGSLETQEWNDKDGNKRKVTKVKVAGFNGRIILLGGGGDRSSRKEQAPLPVDPIADDDNDVPF